MFGIKQRKSFFLTDAEFNKLCPFSVDLEKYATELLRTRSDWTLSDLLNYAFSSEFGRQEQWRKGTS